MRRARTRGWWIVALGVGASAWLATALYGVGPLRAEAPLLGGLAALLVLGLRFVHLRSVPRAEATLGPAARRALLLLSGLGAAAALAAATRQAAQGYEPLSAEAVAALPGPPLGFYEAEGAPLHEALYTIAGREGRRHLAPLEGYGGQLLVLTEQAPPVGRVKVTGRLRDDLRTVQRSPEGQPEGPFLPLYREHMGLPTDAPVYFLDTSVRAGLNLRAVLLFVVPAYLFLLLLGAPTRAPRRRRPPLREGEAPRPGGPDVDAGPGPGLGS